VLPDNRVAILAESSTQIYDPATNSWSVAAAPSSFRTGAAVLLLQDGRVLSVGSGACIEGLEIAEIFDPVANSWIPAGGLPQTAYIAAVVQPDRRVVVIGGGPPCGRSADLGPSPDVFLLDPYPIR
jgi:N-acetylneuraminic acid mutarotase